MKITGEIELVFRDAESGEITDRETIKNLITTKGFDDCLKRCLVVDNNHVTSDNDTTKWIAGIGIGSGNTAPAVTDTDLGTVIALRGIKKDSISTATTKKILFKATFGTDVTGTIREVGLYTDRASATYDSGLSTNVCATEPLDGAAILDLGAGYIFGTVFYCYGIAIADGTLVTYTMDSDWEFDSTQHQVLAIGDKTGYYVVIHYGHVAVDAKSYSTLATRALTAAAKTKTATSILDVIYSLTLS